MAAEGWALNGESIVTASIYQREEAAGIGAAVRIDEKHLVLSFKELIKSSSPENDA